MVTTYMDHGICHFFNSKVGLIRQGTINHSFGSFAHALAKLNSEVKVKGLILVITLYFSLSTSNFKINHAFSIPSWINTCHFFIFYLYLHLLEIYGLK